VPLECADEQPNPAAVAAPLGDADRQAVREQLARIMASDAFRGSKRSREFLSHIAEKTLSGQSILLKERLIGVHLYGKDGAYDTSADSTIRVRANEVRRRLLQYAEQFGRDEAFRILLPAGSYVPEFRPAARLPAPRTVAAPPLHKGWLIGPTVAALLLCGLAFRWMLSPDSLFKEFWRPLTVGNGTLVLRLQAASGSGDGSTIPLDAVRQLLRIHDINRSFGGHGEVVMTGDTPLVSGEASAQILLGRTIGSSLPAPVALRYRVESGAAILDVVSGRRYGSEALANGRQSYALVTRTVPRSQAAAVLSLNGTDDVAVQAAEELVTDPAALGDALRAAGIAAVERDIQILVAVRHSGQEIWKRDIVALQTYP